MRRALTIFAVSASVVLSAFVLRASYESLIESEPAEAQSSVNVYNCGGFTYQEEAQRIYNQDPSDPNLLDQDDGVDDGIACETLPHRPGSASPGSSVDPTQIDSGGPESGLLPLMPDGSCPKEFPAKKNGACY